MCRLVIARYQDLMKYDRRHDALSLFETLETALGGHGNGIAIVSRTGKVKCLHKGVEYTCAQAWDDVRYYGKHDDTVIFHTRLRSAGPVSDEACHPYVYDGLVIAMNGTIRDIAGLANSLGITDTDAIAQLISQHARCKDDVVKACNSLPAVFVGTFNGKPFVAHGAGSPELHLWTDGWLYASQFPAGVRAKKVAGTYGKIGKPYRSLFSYYDSMNDEILFTKPR